MPFRNLSPQERSKSAFQGPVASGKGITPLLQLFYLVTQRNFHGKIMKHCLSIFV